MFFKKFGNILKYNFTDGMHTDVLWMKSSQCKSKKRQDLLGANTGKEDRHPGVSRESDKTLSGRGARFAGAGQMEQTACPPGCGSWF